MDSELISKILVQYPVLLFSLCFHEAAHAWMSNRCGDPSARLLGRLTLDPRKHVDPMGTVVLPLIMMATGSHFLFGWAKPVPFNPANLGNTRRDPVLIALAGPASNLLLATIFTFVLRLILVVAHQDDGFVLEGGLAIAFELTESLISINLLLILFNVIPVPPLDGGYVLKYFLPPRGAEMLDRIGPIGILIALLVIAPLWINPALTFMWGIVSYLATVGIA